MPVTSGEVYHPPNARFQNGNRVYKVVMLGQGGVGKSGICMLALLENWYDPPPLLS